VTNGPLTVTTSAGSATSSSNFTGSLNPIITSFSPTFGTNGSTVTINGGNFFKPVTVTIGGKTESVTPTATSQISATVPTGAANGPISVTTTNGTFTTTSNFLTGSAPIITSFSPITGDTPVTLYGIDLVSLTSVTINGYAEYISGYGSGYVNITITNTKVGTGPITVTSAKGSFTTTSNFTITAAPIINSFAPALAPAGTSGIVINGINFIGATSVKFGTASATFTVTAPTQISATVPSSATTGAITVTSPYGSSITTSNFTVTGAGPVITGFTPSNGVRGTVVTINGGNFTNVSGVTFNGTSGAYTTPTSTTTLYAIAPANATSGLISVITSGGTGNSSALFYFQPWITNATASGIVGSSLIIDGRNLTNATAVQIEGVDFPFTNSPTQIVATVPSNAVPGPVTVTTPGGIFINTSRYVVLPKIYSFTPNIGPAGTVVTIGGTSLFDVTNVQFNGVNATPYNITTNQLQVAVPSGATPGPITVFVPGGSDVSTNIFTATTSSAVNLTKSVFPVVALSGSNLTYTLTVTNNGPSTVTKVVVTDPIPAGFTPISATSSVGSALFTNGQLIASLGTMTTNTGAVITMTGATSTLGILTNMATLGFAEGETIYGNPDAWAFAYLITAAQQTLTIAESANPGHITLTWPVSVMDFTLEFSTNLSGGGGWQAVTNSPFVTNGLNTYTNASPLPAAEYFRLQGP
jgi:hypothetical protein